MGISRAGLAAYEHLIVARVMLYDRLYYHHKTRSAESIVRELIRVTEDELGRQLRFEVGLSPGLRQTVKRLCTGRW